MLKMSFMVINGGEELIIEHSNLIKFKITVKLDQF